MTFVQTNRMAELAKSPVFRDEPIPELEAIVEQLGAARETLARLLIPATELLLDEKIAGVPQPDPEYEFDQLEDEAHLANERLTSVGGRSWHRRIRKAMQPYEAQLRRLQRLWRARSLLGEVEAELTLLAPTNRLT